MTPEALTKLTDLSQAMQEADAARLSAIKAEETRIRTQLAALDAHHREATRLPMLETLPQRSLGGDIKWQVWVGRQRRDLQIQLARCLARQGAARRALQTSFGRRNALTQIHKDLQESAGKKRHRQQDDTITALGLLHMGQGGSS